MGIAAPGFVQLPVRYCSLFVLQPAVQFWGFRCYALDRLKALPSYGRRALRLTAIVEFKDRAIRLIDFDWQANYQLAPGASFWRE
jgi:hypothetical protein